jgi:type IV secretory pathway VirB6-like protein
MKEWLRKLAAFAIPPLILLGVYAVLMTYYSVLLSSLSGGAVIDMPF